MKVSGFLQAQLHLTIASAAFAASNPLPDSGTVSSRSSSSSRDVNTTLSSSTRPSVSVSKSFLSKASVKTTQPSVSRPSSASAGKSTSGKTYTVKSSSSVRATSTTKKSSTKSTTIRSTSTSKSHSTTKKPTTTSQRKTTSTSTRRLPIATPVVDLAWKAGLSGFPGIEDLDIFTEQWMPYISWYSNYEPIAPNMNATNHTVVGAPMLWGKGDQCLSGPDGPVDKWRMGNFTKYVETGITKPAVMFGFYEPDCPCSSSSHIPDVSVGVQKWNALLKPLKSRGIKLGSPPMCTQLDESWLTKFHASGVQWDVTSIHVNKPNATEGKKVVEYYQKFGKPIWVSEFTCVNDHNWSSCGNQATVNKFITEMVTYFESNKNVIAYGANTGEGVPGLWNLMTDTWPKQLSASGKHYQAVLKGLRK